MRRLALSVLLIVAALSVTADAQWWRWGRPKKHVVVSSSEPLLTQSDLTYQGGFRMPTSSSNGFNLEFSGEYLGNGAVGYDSVNNTILLSLGSNGSTYSFCAISIETPINTATPAAMNLATWQQGCVDPSGGALPGDLTAPVESGWRLGGLLRDGSFIYGSAWEYFDTTTPQTKSHFRVSSTLSSGGYAGIVDMSATYGAGWFVKYMGPIPSAWQARLGGSAFMGACCIPIIGRTSNGPSIFSFTPSDIYVASEPLTSYPLIAYPNSAGALDPWDGVPAPNTRYNGATDIHGCAIVDNTSTLLCYGAHGDTFCYGTGDDGMPPDCVDPVIKGHGNHGYPYRYQMYAFDLNDLAAVKAGTKAADTVVPYSYWTVTFPTSVTNSDVSSMGMFYKASTKMLYVTQGNGNGGYPLVHAYLVDDTP